MPTVLYLIYQKEIRWSMRRVFQIGARPVCPEPKWFLSCC